MKISYGCQPEHEHDSHEHEVGAMAMWYERQQVSSTSVSTSLSYCIVLPMMVYADCQPSSVGAYCFRRIDQLPLFRAVSQPCPAICGGQAGLIVTGVGTNVCVEWTVRDAVTRDFHVKIVGNATATLTVEEHEASLKNLGWYGGAVSAREVEGALRTRADELSSG